MSELFDIPETLSPRLRWIREHKVRTHHAPWCEDEPWSAWTPANESPEGLPMDPEACGYCMTEDEAIVELAKKLNLKLWNEL
jgi:hypothetical protein